MRLQRGFDGGIPPGIGGGSAGKNILRYPIYLCFDFVGTIRQTVTRPRNESKDDKKVRKQMVKAEKQARRVEKKATKEEYDGERKTQLRVIADRDKPKMRKL